MAAHTIRRNLILSRSMCNGLGAAALRKTRRLWRSLIAPEGRLPRHSAIILGSVAATLILSACVSAWRTESRSASVQHSPPTPSTPDLCIALSGGGIRSGAVALGALQEFYERGLLRQADYIASVSGGGYPIYGILAQSTHNNATLESLLSPRSKYVADVTSKAAFVDTDAMLSGAVEGTFAWFVDQTLGFAAETTLGDVFHGRVGNRYIVRHSALSADYADDIDKTFGPGISSVIGFPLAQVRVPAGFPTPIFVGAYVEGTKGRRAIFEEGYGTDPKQLFEFSPSWIGSLHSGYWNKFNPHLTVNDAVVASAAAVDAPYDKASEDYQLPDWVKRIGFSLDVSFYLPDLTKVYVADGGFIDNQGVLPLIERGCGEIVAIDASFDPKAEMAGWVKVVALASTLRWTVAPVAPTSNVFSGRVSAWNLPSHIYTSSYYYGDSATAPRPLTIMKLGLHQGDTYARAIEEFRKKNWSQKSSKWTTKDHAWNLETGCNDSVKLKLRCKFPMESTANQSYSAEEFGAYLLMGRHLVDSYCDYLSVMRGQNTGSSQGSHRKQCMVHAEDSRADLHATVTTSVRP